MKEDMRLLYETHDNYDIKVKVGKRDFLCHKAVLISRSEYFRKRLTAEPNADQLVIDKTVVESSDVFEQLLKFIYFNSNDLFERSVEEVLSRLHCNQFADTYRIPVSVTSE